MIRLLTAFLFILALPNSSFAFDDVEAAKLIVQKHIRPGYENLAAKADELDQGARKFCSAPSQEGLETLRTQFKGVMLAWSRVEHIRFGPVAYNNRVERFFFWPDRKGVGRKQIARAVAKRDPTLASVKTLSKKSVALQGLGAMEYLLYGQFAKKFLGEDDTAKFRCQYAMAIAQNLATMSQNVSRAWGETESFPKIFLSPGTSNEIYRFPDEVSAEVIGSFIIGAQLIVRKLTFVHRAYARKTKGAPFERSHLTVSNISQNVSSIYEIQDCCGIGELFSQKFVDNYNLMQQKLAASAPKLDDKLQELLSQRAQRDPNEDVLKGLQKINAALAQAMKLTAEGMAKALNITKKFNSLDGD